MQEQESLVNYQLTSLNCHFGNPTLGTRKNDN
jgi:hypothetical protein